MGETWYNRHGLKEKNYERNKKIMDEMIEKPLSFLFDRNNYEENRVNRHHEPYNLDILETIKKMMKRITSLPGNYSIKDYFTDIRRNIFLNKKEEDFRVFDKYMIFHFLDNDNSFLKIMKFTDDNGATVHFMYEKGQLKTEKFGQTGGKSRRNMFGKRFPKTRRKRVS